MCLRLWQQQQSRKTNKINFLYDLFLGTARELTGVTLATGASGGLSIKYLTSDKRLPPKKKSNLILMMHMQQSPQQQLLELAFSNETPLHSCNMLPEQHDNAFLGPVVHPASFLLSVAGFAINYAACWPVSSSDLQSQLHSQSQPSAAAPSAASTFAFGLFQYVCLCARLCVCVASGSCLPKKVRASQNSNGNGNGNT